jgi:iron complex outermembrane receptor protein
VPPRGSRAAAGVAIALLCASAAARAQAPSPTPTPAPVHVEIVVSANKGAEDPVNVADPVTVVTGEELRRRNVKTIADAIQDMVGVDTGNGSDNGARLANIGLWGLKEFDALLVTVDGVPVGGPFNPSLSQINVEDIDRIEVVRGPQGTLYGVAAFAGMVQVFTRQPQGGAIQGSFAGASFKEWRGNLRWTREVAPDFRLGVFGSIVRGAGWQDRTDFVSNRLTVNGQKRWGQTTLDVSLAATYDKSLFGSPLPVDAGEPLPGFEPDRNYAIGGARLDHHVYSLTANLSTPVSSKVKVENTLGLAIDHQISVRSFIVSAQGDTASATGVSLKPVEKTVYDDARVVAEFEAAGHHRLVGGAAVTWGRTTAIGTGFDFDLVVLPQPIVPQVGDVPVGDNRSFEDRRTFFGFYANDQWTPIPALTISGGLRYDRTSETLKVRQQEVGTPAPDIATDQRTDGAVSGGISVMYRFLDNRPGAVNAVNLYVSGRSNFKPAAPNLAEAESARILEPELAKSGEIGIKTRWLDRTLSLDAHYFDMDFKNLVVSVPAPDGSPALTNAGEESFKGVELDARYSPATLEGLSLAAGYAHHDAKFVHFSFFTPDGDLRVVDGKRLELVPRDLWNVLVSYGTARGPGAFVAVRHQNQRPLNRRNSFYTPSFFETDAGVSWEFPWGRVAFVGRNLGDSRHYIADSEIGDSQFYVAPPRRFTGELTFRF